MSNPDQDRLKIILEVFTRNAALAVKYVSGRALSLAELGAIREQFAAGLRAAFLRGMIAKHNKVRAAFNPWDPDNDPTNPYTRKPEK